MTNTVGSHKLFLSLQLEKTYKNQRPNYDAMFLKNSYFKYIFKIDDCIESIERRPGEEEENGDDSEEDVSSLPSAQFSDHSTCEAESLHLLSRDVEGPGHHDVGHGDDDERDEVLDHQAGYHIR